MAAQKQTKEELLVENAILKNNENTRKMLKEELAPFSEIIKQLDDRMDKVEQDIYELKDIVAPFSKIRNKLWYILIAMSLFIGITSTQFITWVQNIFKQP